MGKDGKGRSKPPNNQQPVHEKLECILQSLTQDVLDATGSTSRTDLRDVLKFRPSTITDVSPIRLPKGVSAKDIRSGGNCIREQVGPFGLFLAQ
jgi:hypothetical protein